MNLSTTFKLKRLHLVVTLLPLLLIACTKPDAEVVVQTEYVKQSVPLQSRPRGVRFPVVDWYVINSDNVDEKLAEIADKTGEPVVIAVTPQGYENLSIGIADMRRYIKQQQSLIVYYEKSIGKK